MDGYPINGFDASTPRRCRYAQHERLSRCFSTACSNSCFSPRAQPMMRVRPVRDRVFGPKEELWELPTSLARRRFARWTRLGLAQPRPASPERIRAGDAMNLPTLGQSNRAAAEELSSICTALTKDSALAAAASLTGSLAEPSIDS